MEHLPRCRPAAHLLVCMLLLLMPPPPCVTDGTAYTQQQMGQISEARGVLNTTAPALKNTLGMMAGLTS